MEWFFWPLVSCVGIGLIIGLADDSTEMAAVGMLMGALTGASLGFVPSLLLAAVAALLRLSA